MILSIRVTPLFSVLFLLMLTTKCHAFSSAALKSKRTKDRTLRPVKSSLSALMIDKDVTTSVLTSVENFFQTEPYVSALLTCSFKASAADFFAQKKQLADGIENEINQETTTVLAATTTTTTKPTTTTTDATVDVRRNMAFLFYGGLYQGLGQQYIFSNILPKLCGSWAGTWQGVAMQVAIDNALIAPLICLPICYAFKELFAKGNDRDVSHAENDGSSLSSLQSSIQSAMEKYRIDVVDHKLLFKYWALWIPVQTMTFSVVPPHFRVAFVAAVSFVWVFILSSLSDSASAADAQPAENRNDIYSKSTVSSVPVFTLPKERNGVSFLVPEQYVPTQQKNKLP